MERPLAITNTLQLSMGFKRIVALAIVAGPLAMAGPAQATTPSGSDFTQALPDSQAVKSQAARTTGAPVLYRTPAITAPRRFDLVGVEGAEGALEFRTQARGDAWTDWVEADAQEPVYAGGADRVQVRSRKGRISGKLHYVRIADGNVPADELLARGARPGKKGGRQAATRPRYITRAEWGANSKVGGCLPRETPERGKVKAGVIHHTVSTNTYTEAEAPGLVLGICRYHRNSNGWNDIGYNALVDRFGNLYEGRAGGMSRAIIGAQAEGVNSQTTGIASIGDNREFEASPAERRTIVKFLAWKLSLAGIDDAEGRATLMSAGGSTQRTPAGQRVRTPRIFSHNFTNITACAGEALISQIPQIRRAIQRKLGASPPVEPTPPDTGGGAAPKP